MTTWRSRVVNCVDGVTAHGGRPVRKSGSIPASTLHFWIGDTNAAMDLVERFHYSRRWPTAVQFVMTAHVSGGLFGNRGDAVAAVVYGIPSTRWSQPVLELSRLVRHEAYRVPLSALVGASVRSIKKKQVADLLVSFADKTQGHHGGVYQACGWKYHGARNVSMDGVIVDGRFIPGRSANNKWGTRSPAKLAALGVAAQPHMDEGKHLYWMAASPQGHAMARELRLNANAYPKPEAA